MNFTLRTKRRGAVSVVFDMTPMIDVTFQLIIFFMFTTQFVNVLRLPLKLPDQVGNDLPSSDAPGIVIDVKASGEMYYETRPIDMTGILSLVKREIGEKGGQADRVRVLVRAEGSARARHVNAIAGGLSQMGVRHWRIATSGSRPEGEGR